MGNQTEKLNHTKLHAEGRKSRQAVLDYLADCLTSPANPTTVEQLNEFKMTSWYFPDIKQAIDKVERVFADKEDLRRAIMLAAAYELIERLIRWSTARLKLGTMPNLATIVVIQILERVRQWR